MARNVFPSCAPLAVFVTRVRDSSQGPMDVVQCLPGTACRRQGGCTVMHLMPATLRMSTAAGFVGRQSELRILGERFAAAEMGRPQVVYVEGEAGGGKSTLLSRFLGSLADAVVLQVGGDEAETLLSYGVIDQLQPGVLTEPGTDPMAVGARLLDLFDRLQSGGQVAVLALDDLQWADRPSARAVLFALRRLRADKVLAVVSTRAGELLKPPSKTRLDICA
jgi:hypothetical protein